MYQKKGDIYIYFSIYKIYIMIFYFILYRKNQTDVQFCYSTQHKLFLKGPNKMHYG